jgi:hypothetical protein
MRAEIADLTEMVIELGGIIATLVQNQVVATQQITAQPEPVAAPVAAPKKSNRAIKAIDHVSDGWNSTDALANAMGVSPTIAYRKLYYLMGQGNVEYSDGRWRKKPPAVAAKPKTNGKVNGRHAAALAKLPKSKTKQRRLALVQ